VEEADRAYAQLAGACARVFVGGESTGAVIALYQASQHREIAGVLCYAPAIRLNMPRYREVQLRLAANFVFALPKQNSSAHSLWQGYKMNPLKGVRELLRLQRATLTRLRWVTQPTLVVQGRLDTTIHPASGAIILGKIPATQKALHWMERSSHVVLLDEELDQITALTLDFMRKVSGERGVVPDKPAS